MTSAKSEPLTDLRNAEWLSWPETQRVFAALGAQGNTVRAVGGAVRDTLLGRTVSEIDLASDASPETVMALAQKAELKVIPTGLDHGTVTVVVRDRPIEVTTLRKDVETFGRRAKVAFTDDWEADARRRDFTINALYANPDGTVFDPLNGLADIAACRVRFIGDPGARISEDYLRILRFFRFLADLNTTDMDADDIRACIRGRVGLETLSGERVHAELSKLLAAEGVVPALAAMFDNGLLVMLLGGVPHLPRLGRLIELEAGLHLEPDVMRRLAALAVIISEDAERLANGSSCRTPSTPGFRMRPVIGRLQPGRARILQRPGFTGKAPARFATLRFLPGPTVAQERTSDAGVTSTRCRSAGRRRNFRSRAAILSRLVLRRVRASAPFSKPWKTDGSQAGFPPVRQTF